MKTTAKILTLALITLMLTSCADKKTNNIITSASSKTETKKEMTNVTYSNITDQDTIKLTENILKNAGVDENSRKSFINEVDKFNKSVDRKYLTDGFEMEQSIYTKYDPYEMQEEYQENNPDFQGYNCRITAMYLYKNYLKTNDNLDLDTSDIVFDLESLKENKSALNNKELNKFISLYASVPTEKTKDINIHAAKLKEEWNKRGIQFSPSDKIKMINVVQNDSFSNDDSHLFIGHAGILLPQNNNELYFLEKVAFQEPYRLNKFNNRKELHNYLMEKYDTSYNQPTAKPFIMENDEIMNVE